jgi:hypothetical protein
MLQMSASRTTSISTLMVLLRLSVKQLPYIAASKFQFVGEFYLKEYATVRRGFFFVFSGAIFGIRWFESFCRHNGSISKKSFLAFRGFDPYRRRDGSVLEGTICKQFVSNAKNRKNLKPCRGFKSFRSLAFRIQFLKNRIFGSSNPSTRRKIENGSMTIRKNLWTKKAEKSLIASPLPC